MGRKIDYNKGECNCLGSIWMMNGGNGMQKKDIEKILWEHKDILAEEYHVSRIGLFGSYVRNEQTEKSDVDILVEFSRPLGLKFVSLKFYLESLFGKPVDLVSSKALKPYIKDHILREVQYQ
jgi:uncharacterized protein